MKHWKGYPVNYADSTRREEVMLALLIILAIIFVLSAVLLTDTALAVVIPIVGISLFVVMVL